MSFYGWIFLLVFSLSGNGFLVRVEHLVLELVLHFLFIYSELGRRFCTIQVDNVYLLLALFLTYAIELISALFLLARQD